MRSSPPLPDLLAPDSPEDVLRGHLWLLELICGTGLRFQMDDSGLLRFGGPEATYGDLDAAPLALRPAIRHVRAQFDRAALRASVGEPDAIVFFGVATHHRGIDYDWERLPPFLGTDVWSTESGQPEAGDNSMPPTEAIGAFRPPDAVAAIFDGVGLDPVNAVERERNARDFDPESYSIPGSAWYDGPAAGVVVRNKRGSRGRIVADRFASARDAGGVSTSTARDSDPETLTERYVTPDRLKRAVGSVERDGTPATVGSLADRAVEVVARETPVRFGDRRSGSELDLDQFRSSVVECARAFLDDRSDR